MLGNKKGKMICGYVPDYVLFDLETTGTSCIYDEVIEISAVKVRSGKVVSRSGGTGDSAILQSIMEFQREVHTGR